MMHKTELPRHPAIVQNSHAKAGENKKCLAIHLLSAAPTSSVHYGAKNWRKQCIGDRKMP
jgi:hypothetical protein